MKRLPDGEMRAFVLDAIAADPFVRDIEIARRLGVTEQAVSYHRRRARIPTRAVRVRQAIGRVLDRYPRADLWALHATCSEQGIPCCSKTIARLRGTQ